MLRRKHKSAATNGGLFADLIRRWNSADAEFLALDNKQVHSAGRIHSWEATLAAAASVPVFFRWLPWLSQECSQRWLGDRVFFFPDGVPLQRRIALISSRLRRRLDLETWWFDLLRTMTLQCNRRSEAVLVAESTTACEAAARAACLFGRSMIRIRCPDPLPVRSPHQVEDWFRDCLNQMEIAEATGTAGKVYRVWVSPEINLDLIGSRASSALWDSLPLADRLLFAAADRLQVLACRSRGVVAELLRRHLNDEERQRCPVLVAADEAGRLPAVTSLLPDGWVPLLLEPCLQKPGPAADRDVDSSSRSAHRLTEGGPLEAPADWLLHWTRAASGPWPNEPTESFFDALLLHAESDRSALTTLLKIIAEGRLLASSDGIRGAYKVVAFTGVPLGEFRQRRVFRRHRHRFDFEPWGIAVRRTELQKRGVRPVRYGDDNLWRRLPAEEKPFFQKATRGGATSNLDEAEWRVTENVDLTGFPQDAVRIFVDTAEAAEMLALHCPWAIIVLPKVQDQAIPNKRRQR